MPDQLTAKEFLTLRETYPVIDVRSPAEFERGHIPGAISMPLFSNEERAEVGTTYTRISKEQAILKGLDFVGPKMSSMVKTAGSLSTKDRVLVYCWRGGMRSNSVAWLLNTAGIETSTLAGGYKSYRRFLRQKLSEPLNLIVLSGMTGSGKTDFLSRLSETGEQVIDLEGLANHRGSAFGAIGQPPQPTTEAFENLLLGKILQFDPQKRIWIEDESKSIGRVFVPDELYEQMDRASSLVIEMSREMRAARLVEEYASFDKEQLCSSLAKISKRMGGNNTKLAIESIQNNNFLGAAGICLEYYDKTYKFGLKKHNRRTVTTVRLTEEDPGINTETILKAANKHFPEVMFS
ncbi:MAG TPA: tRNA 2-selenouridine(34) synthase MnmH [Bacteroidales bacterium]|nr:tRNA 2-selenouridine(34) synthase MnmH [Bacteroidales bacterium]